MQKSGIRLQEHRRQTDVFQAGTGSERVALASDHEGGVVWLEHRLPPALALDELKLSVQLRLNVGTATLLLRVVFPHEHNPKTGGPAYTLLKGESYANEGRWQALICTTASRDIAEQVRTLRLRLPEFNPADAYVDRVYLRLTPPAGQIEIHLDELHLGPVVEPRPELIVPASNTVADEPFPVEFRLGRLLLGGEPFFPRITPYHGERPEVLKLAGIDVVWVPDFEDEALLRRLRPHDLWATASPPGVTSDEGRAIGLNDVSMLPFTERTRDILFWNLGTRVPAEERENLAGFVEQIRAADRKFKRPLMVDIIGGQERTVSRGVDLLAVSRHICNTTFTPKQYRDWLIQRRMLAQQGQFLWTWIQTEPATANAERRDPLQRHPIVIEPEQIRMQVYAALAAGCRGIGFFKSTSLDRDEPGDLERRLILAQLGLELDLLEPWLATGVVEGQQLFDIAKEGTAPITRKSLDFQGVYARPGERQALLRESEDRGKRASRLGAELEAAIIKTDSGTLLLPIWYDQDAQFVPGQMAANNATITVPGVPETAQAYEITTTSIHPVSAKDQRRVTGGMKIALPRFDQTAAVLVTADRSVIDRLRQRQAEVAQSSAQISVELARAKLARVGAVDAELRALGAGLSDGAGLLAGAKSRADLAEQELGRGNCHLAREFAGESLQLLRILQRAHWDNAVRSLSSAVSSPHTICFQTLPDHWEMARRVGRGAAQSSANLLASGNFENREQMMADGWQHAQNEIDGVRANADLYPSGRTGQYALRLIAVPEPGDGPPAVLPRSPVIVTTPAVPVREGQVVQVSGWVRLGAPITGSLDGAMLYDSITGPSGALRWHTASDWSAFRLIREVQQNEGLTLTLVLNGLGEIQVDDLEILAFEPGTGPPPPIMTPRPEERNPFSPMQLLERIPRLRSSWGRQ